MIESRKTGAYISRLRKERNWTQMQLADRLNVTHQAVSRWENGDSLPDIAILVNLAQVFEVSVDELLNGEAARAAGDGPGPELATRGNLISALAQGRTEEIAHLIRQQQANVKTLIEVAPVTQPNLLKGVIENMK